MSELNLSLKVVLLGKRELLLGDQGIEGEERKSSLQGFFRCDGFGDCRNSCTVGKLDQPLDCRLTSTRN